MRTRTLTIGLIILIVGIALATVGGYSLRSTTKTITSFTEPSAGEYVSAKLVLNDSIVVVRPPAKVGGMVPAQDVSKLNSTDVGTYTVPYNSSAASSETYIGLQGNFNYIIFSSAQPTTKIVVTGTFLETITLGLLVLAGIVCAIVGIIITVIGALRGNPTKKATISESEYYAKRDSAPQS